MASRIKRSVPVTVNDVLDGHVALDLECLDRLYLHGYLGQLQVGGQVIQFLNHRGYPLVLSASGRRQVTRLLACRKPLNGHYWHAYPVGVSAVLTLAPRSSPWRLQSAHGGTPGLRHGR